MYKQCQSINKGEFLVSKPFLGTVNKKIFFDESGKDQDYPILMGAFSIPTEIYELSDFNTIQGTKSHWVNFTRKEDMKTLLAVIAKYHEVVDINVINYNYNAVLEDVKTRFSDPVDIKYFSNKAIYAKFPERIFYGLLRNYPQYVLVDAEVVIENGTEYDISTVKEVVEKDLNVQGIYRGEPFKISKVDLKPKGVDVGLEIVDLLLGIMRTIIINQSDSKRKRKKNNFIISLFKENPDIKKLFKEIRFFEWNHNEALKEVKFSKYIEIFLASNKHLWWD